MKVLLHVCCGPCACACVPRLKAQDKTVTLFYSNSNIDTAEEFKRREEAARKLAETDGVPFVVDAYDHARWLTEVAAGFENEPEKGRRCDRCFRFSLTRAFEYAAQYGYDAVATSLTVSPHKPSERIFAAGEDAAWCVGTKACGGSACAAPILLKEDFKKKEGFKLSVKRAAELGLYRQNYCGCEFSHAAQQKRSCNFGKEMV